MAKKKEQDDASGPLDVETASRLFMMYGLLPGWFIPGLLDWYWHKQTKIEETSGARESAIHALMMTEAGAAIMLGLFLEIDAGVLAAMLAAVAVHEATAMWDVAYASTRRDVRPREQHTHSFLESLPVMATAFAACLHPDQAKALIGIGPERPRWKFRRKDKPLSPVYVGVLLTSVAAFIGVPYGEELIRCLRREPTFAPRPIPASPPETHDQLEAYRAQT